LLLVIRGEVMKKVEQSWKVLLVLLLVAMAASIIRNRTRRVKII